MATHAINVVELMKTMRNLLVGRLCSAAAITLVLYDWSLVFQKEYDTVHHSRWSLPKSTLLYIRIVTPLCLSLNAYVSSDFRPTVTDTLSGSRCKTWVFAQSFGMVTCLFAANGLLALRLMALYRRKKLLVWFITVFYLSSYITTFGLLVHTMTIYHDSIHYSEVVKSCQAAAHSPTISAVFYAPAAFETFVFGMTAYSAMKDARVITGKSAPFLVILYRDGFISFFVMVALRIWNCWIYMTQPVSSYAMGTPFMWAANAVLTTRIYINLVWLAKKPLCTVSEYPGHAGIQEVRASINFRMPPTTFNSRTGYLSSTDRGLEMTPSKLRHHDRDDGYWP
ncbi:hypothetical protein FRC17_001885 [Serendipita sp. 399]|nr:hypothetical protein FRC17_001885 [Serendipita sp. 399]